jgi:hypothetical protein
VYEYDPVHDTYADDDNLVRQLATTWVTAQLAHRGLGRRDVLERALRYIFARMRPAATHGDGVVVSDRSDCALLGASAFALLTLVDSNDDGFKDAAHRLADAILSLQRPDGGFHTEIPAMTRPEAEDFFPGEAMLALMHLHARYPDSRYPASLDRALPYYRAHFRRHRSSAFVAWQMAAYANLYRWTGNREYAEFVFELADAILPLQHVGATAPYPDYVGGYRSRGAPGIPSATYNEGVLEAYDVAKRAGDRDRTARYQRAALLAGLFTLRLQFVDDNSYYVQHPGRARGAFRASLVNNALRIDHTQHALNSLLKIEHHLLPPADAAPRPEAARLHGLESRP